jgi:DNA (cytosine-5)-methyltransferase 1
MTTVRAVDLFCGAGGLSGGLKMAASALGVTVDLIAINHWDVAIATHRGNHPEARHLCTGVESVDPWDVIPADHHVDILVAGPQCTYFSRARGGRPVTNQQRVSPWLILDWLEKLDVDNVLIENVPEFRKWGPVKDGRPVRELCGQTFAAYIEAIKSLGYHVEYRVLNCANYGDATTRRRLFIMARRGKPVRWPPQTHASPDELDRADGLFRRQIKPWKPAREIIDWSVKGESIYERKRPLAKNTLRRIAVGLERFSGIPFVLGQQSGSVARSVEEPIPTVATEGAISLVEPTLRPFVLPPAGYYRGDNLPRDVDQPLQTITSRGGGHLVQPFLVKLRNNSDVVSIDDPLPTLTAGGGHLGLCCPFLIPFYSERQGQAPRTHSIDDPVPTITGDPRFGLVEPYIIPVNHGNDTRAYSIDEPLRTITGVDAWAMVEPYLIQHNGTSEASSIDRPVPTMTTKDRFGLVEPVFLRIGDGIYMLDILFRMLLPHELAAATSFPSSYKFEGNRGDVVKQIGNAVPVKTAKALCEALLAEA